MKKTKYKAAVIGLGRIGAQEELYRKEVQPGTHAGAFSGNSRIILAGLADLDPKKLAAAKKLFPKALLFSSAEKMLKEVKPDIVSVAVPVEGHLPMVELASQYGARAIICEKPITPTIGQAKQMIGVCKKSNSLLFVNHTRRFDPLLNKVRDEIQAGKIGKLVQTTGYYYNGLFNNGTHLVDLLRFFLGDIDWLWAKENKETRKAELINDLNVDAVLHFKSGVRAVLQSLPANYVLMEVYFYGQKGAFFLRDSCYKVEYRKLAPHKYYKGYEQLSPAKQSKGEIRSFMPSMAENVVRCLDSKAKPASSGQDGLAVLKVLDCLKQSARQGGKIIKLN